MKEKKRTGLRVVSAEECVSREGGEAPKYGTCGCLPSPYPPCRPTWPPYPIPNLGA